MYHITLQNSVTEEVIPAESLLQQWAEYVLRKYLTAAELTIRITDEVEMTELNTTYRHKQGATNILSFPFMIPDGVKLAVPILGDLVICAAVVNREAKEQDKPTQAHWAHMVVHGILHLLGYDHEQTDQAEEMEALEITIMQELGFANPYEE